MHMLVRLSLILFLLGSTSGGLFKKKNKKAKVKNKDKRIFKKFTGEIDLGGNYIGVKVAAKAKNELNYDQAQAYCQSKYSTSLATILTKDDQEEIEELLYSDDWGKAVVRVWVGFKKMNDNPYSTVLTENKQYAWKPCSDCPTGSDCSAADTFKDTSFHKISYPLWGEDLDDVTIGLCGVLRRGNKAALGTWGLNQCWLKREFICNSPTGNYATLPWDECASSESETDDATCDSDGALNIAFLLDESLDLVVANKWAEAIVETDVNDASYVSVFEFKGDDWITYRQTVDFTKDKDAVFTALQNNIEDTTYDDFNQVAVKNNVDVLDKVMTLIHDDALNQPDCGDDSCQSNVIVVFLSGSSKDILSNTVAEYNKGVGVIFVVIGGDEEVSTSFPNVVKLAENRFSDWNGENVFAVDAPVSETEVAEVQAFIREKVCTSLTSSAWSVNGAMIGEELIVNGKPSFVGALVGLMVILLVVNVICLTISNCQKRNTKVTKHRYQVVDVESSTELSS